ncbi:MAG: peptidylprolyl isomerase [Cyclobacteriaceae bacterium]|nr:peptidylprolyl isomerase [Cyclobacteriaceae bacterium]
MRLLYLACIVLLVGCERAAINKFSDDQIVKIYDLQDRRATDSLLVYLRSSNATYRSEAALALASVQDSLASVELGTHLLEDPDVDVRHHAAFALGQTGGFQAVNALLPALQSEDHTVAREVLEALGKTITKNDLGALREFHATDSLLEEGLSWACYHLALRKLTDSLLTKRASEFLVPSHSYQTRLGAAHFFGRSSKIEGKSFEENLVAAATKDIRPEVRMAAASGIKHLPLAQAKELIQRIIASEPDYRVRANAVRAIQNFAFSEMNELALSALHDSIHAVSVAASEVIRNKAEGLSADRLKEEIEKTISHRAKANLWATLLKTNSSHGAVEEIIRLSSTADTYFKAALYSALGEARPPTDQKAMQFLSQQLLAEGQGKVLLTSAAAALTSLDARRTTRDSKNSLLNTYQQAIASGDAGVIGIVASALTNEALQYKKEITDLKFLYDAKAKLNLPKDIESLQPLEEAIAFLEGKDKPVAIKNPYNHPIDWKRVKTIPRNQLAQIKTANGLIVVRLFVEESPGSVANFISLAEQKYFDGKFFHRVVPNFVVQAGCNRGDGYGSEDYAIRSEFSRRRYTTGSMGMASAGKDTEGTQWFITHSPTPHLDGKYTIFAEVQSGMENVHRLEVGDQMVEVTLLPTSK